MIVVSGDVNYNSVSLLLHFDGANGSTTFTDNSPSPKTVTRNGNAQISTAESKFGGASAYFDGNADWVETPNSSAFVFGTGDFTVEAFIKIPTQGHDAAIIDFFELGVSGWQLYVNSSGFLTFYQHSPNINLVASGATVTDNNWHHVAASRNSGTLRLFVDGTKRYDASNTKNHANINVNLGIGAQIGSRNSAYDLEGYIDEVRITKGVGRYTADFTAPVFAFPDFEKLPVRALDPGPLGVANTLGYVEPRALVSDFGPLGTVNLLAQQWAAIVSASSPLGPEQITAWHLFARADVPTMLGNANPLAWHLFARADVPSMLGAANPLATHDFTEVIGDATTYYVMDLTTPSGVVRVPISSWQATLQTGLSNYVQCVVPAVSAYVSAINAATQFKISRLVDVPGLAAPLTYEMATAPVQTTTFDQGPFRYSCTISGYSSGFAPNETPSAAYNRIMQGIRSISINQGGTRVRCSIDWLLRPSQRVFASSEEFVVSYINYYVGEGDAYMEVGERA